MDIQAYLSRIGFRGPVEPTLETLRALHYAHLLTVPFENLDIPERPIVLDEAHFFDKIVGNRRGGFCYELNGLFAGLLRELGFRVSLLSARVSKANSGELREFDHLALRVDLDTPWLADVGFGESFCQPLPLAANAENVECGMVYRLECSEDCADAGVPAASSRWRVITQRGQNGNGLKVLYDFTLVPHELGDFDGMCRYHQSAPESPFMQRRICTRLTPAGRVTLANLRLIITDNGARQERTLADEQEHSDALQRYFGIVLPDIEPQRRTNTEEAREEPARSA